MNTLIKTPWGEFPLVNLLLGGAAAYLLASILAKNKFGAVIVIGGAGFLLWKLSQKNQGITFAQPLPPGAKPTGKIQVTTHGGKPGEQVVGWAKQTWAQVMYPSGQQDWVEIKVQ